MNDTVFPVRHRARTMGQWWQSLLLILGVPVVILSMVLGIMWVTNDPMFRDEPAAIPVPEFTRQPVPVPTAAPTDIPDVVIAAAPAIRLEIPSISFDSNNLVLPAGQVDTIEQWTDADNVAHNGALTPKEFDTSLLQDTTVPGGGLFGTNVETNGLIAGHTTPYTWQKLGVFQNLIHVVAGDLVAITTVNGRLCYSVAAVDNSTPKMETVVVNGVEMSAVDAKYRYAEPTPGVAYLVTCYRLNDGYTGPTSENLVLVLQFNQDLTSSGQC